MAESSVAPSSLEKILGSVPLFADLDRAQVTQLCRSSRRLPMKTGDLVIVEGTPGEALYIILAGELEVSKRDGDRDLVLARRKAVDFLGEMSLIEHTPRTASARATTDGELLEIGAAAFRSLLETNPGFATTILRTMAGRLRSTEASLMQREKLASLGTLAAGLAHELNNPAAAVQRSASTLMEALDAGVAIAAKIASLALTPAEGQHLEQVRAELAVTTSQTPRPATATLEEALASRLEAAGVDNHWDITPALAAFGWTGERLDAASFGFRPSHQGVILSWLGNQLLTRQLAAEIEESGRAITDIVRGVKAYSYLDQAAVQPVDIVRSLEDTMMVLKHKLKGSITVVRHFDSELPRIEAYAGELNQVWTNLIDNAVDAMEGKGTLTLHALRIGEAIEVRIADTGSGIPTGVAERIFDPFFTTKPQGVGTGLGLHIAHNIVVNRHRGDLSFETSPAGTSFKVTLPLRPVHGR